MGFISKNDKDAFMDFCQKINHLSRSDVAVALQDSSVPSWLKDVTILAIDGDNRPLNRWLFGLTDSPGENAVWIAPVTELGVERFSWMVGSISELQGDVKSLFLKAQISALKDPVLLQENVPPPLLFINPEVVSRKYKTPDVMGEEDEFAIFQTSYRDSKSEIWDFDQRMILNARYLRDYRLKVLRRYKLVGDGVSVAVIDCYQQNAELFALVHSEGHNQGHFLGPWPFDEVKKKSILYEALEEYRSCLAAVSLSRLMGLGEVWEESFALSVFLTRVLGYGYEGYVFPRKNRELTREIGVASLALRDALRFGAIKVTAGRLVIDTKVLLLGMHESLKEIHDNESRIRARGLSGIQCESRTYLQSIYPEGCFLPELMLLYKWVSLEGKSHENDPQ